MTCEAALVHNSARRTTVRRLLSVSPAANTVALVAQGKAMSSKADITAAKVEMSPWAVGTLPTKVEVSPWRPDVSSATACAPIKRFQTPIVQVDATSWRHKQPGTGDTPQMVANKLHQQSTSITMSVHTDSPVVKVNMLPQRADASTAKVDLLPWQPDTLPTITDTLSSRTDSSSMSLTSLSIPTSSLGGNTNTLPSVQIGSSPQTDTSFPLSTNTSLPPQSETPPVASSVQIGSSPRTDTSFPLSTNTSLPPQSETPPVPSFTPQMQRDTPNMLDGKSSLWSVSSLHSDLGASTVSLLCLRLCFSPNVYSQFAEQLLTKQVLLADCTVVGLAVQGTVFTLPYQTRTRRVHVRYTMNDWVAYAEVEAKFGCDMGRIHRYDFVLRPPKLELDQRLQWAIRFTTGDIMTTECWDNNDGQNYTAECYYTLVE